MTIATKIRRSLGTMIVYGFARSDLEVELAIAGQLGVEVLEILPCWSAFPDPRLLKARLDNTSLTIHSAHGCWGSQCIRADRVDLGSTDPTTWSASLDDVKRCVDWLAMASGSCLVVHPGGLSQPERQAERRDALTRALGLLADHAQRTGVTVCVENMPPGVFPGSRMKDLFEIVEEINRREIALALDAGHAHISAHEVSETLAAGRRLSTTHVHDNNGKHDTHLPPGQGTIDWEEWVKALDAIEYRGPILLECIKHLRDKPESLTEEFLGRLQRMTGLE